MPPLPLGAMPAERINAEIFTLTYGSVVRQLLSDLEDVEAVNKELDKMGYNIGTRLIDEFLSKTNTQRCLDFRDAADKVARSGFKMFLGVTATTANWAGDGSACSIILEENPLADFVELPESFSGLVYCNILCGVIRGALEMVGMHVQCRFLRDMLKGDDAFEIRVKLTEQQPEHYPFKDDD
mmetsp:Transcript_14455/g.25536  ORF Transcript_14455/g.25536 Transcript_14455/m.25536 type:complete len:182 (-) Transcript_14455:70-615(-)